MKLSYKTTSLAGEKAKKTKKAVKSVLRLDREPCLCKECRGGKSYPPKIRQEHKILHGLMTPEPPSPIPQLHASGSKVRTQKETTPPSAPPSSPVPLRSPTSTRSLSPMAVDSSPPQPPEPRAHTSSAPPPRRSPLRVINSNSPSHSGNLPQGSSEPLMPRLSAVHPRLFFIKTPSPIPNDPSVNLQVPSPFGGANNFDYPDFWSPPAFQSPLSVGSQFTLGSQRSEPVHSPPAPPPSRSPTPPALLSRPLTPAHQPTPFVLTSATGSSRHSRSSSASSGLANEPIRFATPADDNRFYEDLLGEHQIAPPPPLQHNNLDHASNEPARDYYEPSDVEDEDEIGCNPNDSPPRANSPGPAVPNAGHNHPPAVDDLDLNNPGGADDPANETFAAFLEPARLRNIYIRTYAPSVFAGATKKDTHATLENIRLALEDAEDSGDLPADIQNALPKMARTVRSLRHRLGVNTDDLLRTYTLCTACGKRYSSDFIKNTNTPNCPRLIDNESCGNPLYVETVLQNGKRSRKPIKSFPYLSIKLALEHLLARPGMKEIMRGGQQPGHNDQGPQEPSTRQEWLDLMPDNRRFGAMSEGWGWKSQHARMTREYSLRERRYHDLEPEDGPVSLVSLPNGLSLTIFFDGIQAHEHQKYEVQAVYITVNNIPSHLRTLIENIILVIVIPGPNQPTAYELDQILEPLVDELLELEQGVEMQVYDQDTRRMVRETVYARLSLGVLDYIARLKLTGHAGVASEDHFCLYCTKKLSQLSVRDGYQDIDLRNPSVHLQRKHEWLRAQGDPVEQERLRKRYGTIFTELDRLPGWYAPTSCPIDGMHLFDLGMTKRIYKDIIFRPGLLQHRRGQPEAERPVARFEDFIKRTYFPSHCSRLPPKLAEAKGRIKAEQWRNMAHILHAALFEAWRVGDAIPNTDIPRGGTRTKIYAEQNKMAEHLYAARCRVHADEGGAEEDEPSLDDCRPSRNPRDYYKVVLCYLVARNILFSWQHSLAEVEFAQQLLWRVNTSLVDMNVPLPPTAHLLMHVEEHIQKYGSLYGTSTNAFERANKVLVGTNTNGRGSGCMEETMARGFWQRADFFRLIRRMQAIPNPTRDDTATIEVMLRAVRNAPEHEVQRGLLDQVLAGEVPFQGQERVWFPSVSAQVILDDETHRPYAQILFDYCAAQLDGYALYIYGRRPPNGVRFPRKGSTTSFSHVHHAGFRFGSDSHYRGKCSRYGYVKEGLHGRTPALVKMIYKVCLTTPDNNVEHNITCAIVQRFVPPEHRPRFPWHHWQFRLGTGSWRYNVLQEPEAIPIDHLVGVFALSDITMAGIRYWLTFSMDHSEPEPLED